MPPSNGRGSCGPTPASSSGGGGLPATRRPWSTTTCGPAGRITFFMAERPRASATTARGRSSPPTRPTTSSCGMPTSTTTADPNDGNAMTAMIITFDERDGGGAVMAIRTHFDSLAGHGAGARHGDRGGHAHGPLPDRRRPRRHAYVTAGVQRSHDRTVRGSGRGPGRQEEVLHGGVGGRAGGEGRPPLASGQESQRGAHTRAADELPQPRRRQQGPIERLVGQHGHEHDGRRPGQVQGQVIAGPFHALPTLAVLVGPQLGRGDRGPVQGPGPLIGLGHPLLLAGIPHDDEGPVLGIAAGRSVQGGVDQPDQQFLVHRIGAEPAHGPALVHDVDDRVGRLGHSGRTYRRDALRCRTKRPSPPVADTGAGQALAGSTVEAAGAAPGAGAAIGGAGGAGGHTGGQVSALGTMIQAAT